MLLTKSFFNPALLRSDLRRCWPLFAGYTFLWFLILPLRMWNDVPADLQAAHPYEARSVALEIIANATTAASRRPLVLEPQGLAKPIRPGPR